MNELKMIKANHTTKGHPMQLSKNPSLEHHVNLLIKAMEISNVWNLIPARKRRHITRVIDAQIKTKPKFVYQSVAANLKKSGLIHISEKLRLNKRWIRKLTNNRINQLNQFNQQKKEGST